MPMSLTMMSAASSCSNAASAASAESAVRTTRAGAVERFRQAGRAHRRRRRRRARVHRPTWPGPRLLAAAAGAGSGARGRGEPDDEVRPLVLPVAVRLDRSVVQLDEMADDREPEPDTAVRACRRAVGLAKALEDVREEFGRDADAGVADAEAQRVVLAVELDVHLAAGRA